MAFKKKRKGAQIFLTIVLILGIVIFGFYAYNQVALKQEAKLIIPIGQMIDLGEYRLHIYAEGEASEKPTLVFMSGSATVAPTYDFKILYDLLSDEYHIVVVEKAGYGYSDIIDIQRDIDSMVEDTRRALELAGEAGPFVLVPHSMSGLEAIYWAQQYPDEVAAIIGLDMSTPYSYETFDQSRITKMSVIGRTLIKLGLHRIPGIYPLNTEALTKEEIKQQKLLMYRNAVNVDYIREGESVLANAEKVINGGFISCPVLLFSSNGKEIGDFWIGSQEKFAEDTHAKLIVYDCGHYIHYYKSTDIAEEIKTFLDD